MPGPTKIKHFIITKVPCEKFIFTDINHQYKLHIQEEKFNKLLNEISNVAILGIKSTRITKITNKDIKISERWRNYIFLC